MTLSSSAIVPAPSWSAVFCASARSRSPIATFMPWRMNASAVALPMPRAAPVIAATWPVRTLGCFAMVTSKFVTGASPYHPRRYAGTVSRGPACLARYSAASARASSESGDSRPS